MAPSLFKGSKTKKPGKKGKGTEDTIMEDPEHIVVLEEHEQPPPPPKSGGLFKSLLGKKHKESAVGPSFSKPKPWYKSLTVKRRRSHEKSTRRATVEDVSDAGYVATSSLTEGALKLYNDGGHHHHHHHHEPSVHSQDYVEDHLATREHTLVPGGGLTDDGGVPRGTVLMLDRDSQRHTGYHLHDSPQGSVAVFQPAPVRQSLNPTLHDLDLHRVDGSSSGDHGGYSYGGYSGGRMLVRNASQRTHQTQHSGIVMEPGVGVTVHRVGDSPVMLEHPDRMLHHSDSRMLHHSDSRMLHHPDSRVLHHSDSRMLHHPDGGMLHHSDGGVLHHSDSRLLQHHPDGHQSIVIDRHPSIVGSIPHGPLSHKASVRSALPPRSGPPTPRIVETPNGTFQEYSGNVILVVDEGVELEIGNEETGFIPYEEYLKSPAAHAPPPQKEEVFVVQGGKNMIFQDEHGNVIPELRPDENGILVPRSGTYQRNVDGSITIWR